MLQESSLAKILLVEDDSMIATVVHDVLRDAGYACKITNDGISGLAEAAHEEFDLLILDVNLPKISGLDVCRQFKVLRPAIPVILLTARTDEADIVAGLEIGADDYITKPFKPRELLARVRARLREQTQKTLHLDTATPDTLTSTVLTIGEITIDLKKMRVFKGAELLQLSAREYSFIALLAQNAGRPFFRDDLLSTVWGFDNDAYAVNISVFVSRLRRKIEDDPLQPRYLLTARGVGYRFIEPGEFTEAMAASK